MRGLAPSEGAWNAALRLDEAALVKLCGSADSKMTPPMRFLTRLGNTSGWAVMILTLLAAGGDAARVGLTVLLAATLGATLAQIGKRLWRRPRPDAGIRGFVALMENPDRFSFPSGHTSTAFAVAIALAGSGLWLGPLSLALAVGIATSRVYLGAHYPIDVGAGLVLGSLAGWLTRLLVG